MTINEIKNLISNNESRTLELKKSTGELKDAMHSACAFLNTDGGTLIFGITPTSLKIVGQEVSDNTQREIAEALREALINAICHRQYEKYNLTIGISIYDDRVEIENPGIFPQQLTVETIRQPHISYPYNPIIAEVLFKTTFLENWGSGIGRIIEKCKECNLQEPEWSVKGGFVTVTFKRPINDTNEPINEPINEPNKSINKRQKTIIDLMKVNPRITRLSLSQELGVSLATIKRELQDLNNKQIIKYVGNKKSGHWEIFKNLKLKIES